MAKKINLACEICGSRNYSTDSTSESNSKRLEIKKYCKHCNAHTVHKQTK